MSRLIPKELIPSTLWDHESSILHLPPCVASGWKLLLEKNGLFEKAMTRAPKGFEGGMTKEETDDHFAWRFTGSVARMMLPVLDPKQELNEISDVFTQFFAGNRVFLADLPCGAGATSLSILSVYCELRKQGLIPREPLEVVVVGGEISKFAQCYANDGLAYLVNELEDQAITLEFDIIDWNVCDPFSNADLIRHLTLRSQDCAARVLIMANFSGFLHKEKKWKEAKGQIDELFRFNRGKDSVALWIEPQTNLVTTPNGFLSQVIDWFKSKFSSIASGKDIIQQTSSVNVEHPLTDKTFKTHLAVVRFDLPLR